MGLPERVNEQTYSYADRKRTFDVCQQYGVTEYWIVDIDERVLEAYLRDPSSGASTPTVPGIR